MKKSEIVHFWTVLLSSLALIWFTFICMEYNSSESVPNKILIFIDVSSYSSNAKLNWSRGSWKSCCNDIRTMLQLRRSAIFIVCKHSSQKCLRSFGSHKTSKLLSFLEITRGIYFITSAFKLSFFLFAKIISQFCLSTTDNFRIFYIRNQSVYKSYISEKRCLLQTEVHEKMVFRNWTWWWKIKNYFVDSYRRKITCIFEVVKKTRARPSFVWYLSSCFRLK